MANAPITVRASAALAAAGAYDAAPTTITLGAATLAELRWTYTRGIAGGQCKFKIDVSDASGGTYYDRTIDQGTLTITAGEAVTNLYTAAKAPPVPAGAGAESRSYLFDVSTAAFLQVSFAEVGNIGTPGTVVASIVLAST